MISEDTLKGLEMLGEAKAALKAGNLDEAKRHLEDAAAMMSVTPEVWRVGKAVDALQMIPESGWAKVKPGIVDLMPGS